MSLSTSLLAANVGVGRGLSAALGTSDTKGTIVSLFLITATVAIALLLSPLTRKRVPGAVWLLILDVIIRPNVFGFVSLTKLIFVPHEVGMGMFFFITGAEIDVEEIRGRAGRRSLLTRLVCFSIGLAVSWVAVAASGMTDVTTTIYIALATALTSTAFGTLLSILVGAGVMGTTTNKAALVHGTVGELASIITMSPLLSTYSPWAVAIALLLFALATILAVAIPTRFILKRPAIGWTILHGAQTSQRTLMHVVMLVLTSLVALFAAMELDMVLGAFAADIIVRALALDSFTMVESELYILDFSFLIPLFFVTSGMNISLSVAAGYPFLLVVSADVILMVCGVSTVLPECSHGSIGQVGWMDAIRIGLYGAMGLPIIVAITELGIPTRVLPSWLASLPVVAGALLALLFPLLVLLLGRAGGRAR